MSLSCLKVLKITLGSLLQVQSILPNVNSSVGNPEAERAVTKAEGPGIGTTGIPLSTHNLACIKSSDTALIKNLCSNQALDFTELTIPSLTMTKERVSSPTLCQDH